MFDRPLADKRPIGPFAQTSDPSGVELVVFTNVDIPQSAADDIKRAAENEMGSMMDSVEVMDKNSGFVINVGTEILLQHVEFKTHEDLLSAVIEELNDMMDVEVVIQEVTARSD